MARLQSTGRKPALDLVGVESLLTSYFSEAHPSVSDLAKSLDCTEATVRKYLKLALGSLPRGRAAALPREVGSIKALLNGIPTEALLGAGRVELLVRHRAAGASLTALAAEFGISRDRVSKLLASRAPVSEAPEGSESEPEAAEASPEVSEPVEG